VSKILVVDDEPTLVATLKYNLEREGYEVVTASDGESGLEAARAKRPDLVILDLMLPGMSGLEVCRSLRRESSAPVLMLTARGTETDKVVGLELGADDYVTKPFSMPEVLARVRALLRRSRAAPDGAEEAVVTGDLRVDVARREASRGGIPLSLKPKEFDLLLYFARHRSRALSREELLNQIWGYEFAGDTRTVDVHVRWLRQKIEADAGNPKRLVTVRGTGYRFEG
jgi:DNA-binding response OmpR family regulator